MLGLIGKKLGMTQLFDESGTMIPVTAIEAGPCPIVQIKTEERDGYRAVQLGFGEKRRRRVNKAGNGHAARGGLSDVPAVLREFPLSDADELADDPHTPAAAAAPVKEEPAPAKDAAPADETEAEAEVADETETEAETVDEGEAAADEAEEAEEMPAADLESGLRVGQTLTVSIFEPGERIRVTGQSKGRGFQGVIKRHGFGGYPKTHGHPYMRIPGSIGPGNDPSRVIKGRKMSGRMGGKRRTVRNLQVFRVDPERNLIFVKGSVPGAPNGLVLIRKQ